MPRIAIDYSKTLIYKIVCNDLTITDVYVGSTTDFTRRKSCHKSSCNNINSKKYDFKVYQTIRANGGWENWSMILVENFPCENVNESHARERFWHETLNANLNIQVPNRLRKEYKKEYHDKNKLTILPKHNIYKKQIILCCCGIFTTFGNKAKHERTKRHQKHFEIINCCI
jgi:hypothetical protein